MKMPFSGFTRVLITLSYQFWPGLYPAVCFRVSMKLSEDHRVAEGHESRRVKRRAGRGLRRGCPPPQVRGKILKFEAQFGAFGKKFTFLQLSTFVNENIVIVLDSGIDIVTYYFNFFSCMNALSFVL